MKLITSKLFFFYLQRNENKIYSGVFDCNTFAQYCNTKHINHYTNTLSAANFYTVTFIIVT